ncbi:MAG: hypothetical protein ACREQ5_00480 [Candidatus Dormibacteria bacterium]
MADNPTPLATGTQLSEGAFTDLVRSYTPPALNDIMIQATRACETETGRRLAPFTLTETHRADGVDPDEYTDAANLPLDLQGTLGRSYAYNLGASTLVRHCWLNEYAPLFQDMWTYSDVSITIVRSYGGSQTLTTTQIVGPELDTGHILFNLGLFIPIGSWIRVTYSGGYTVVPADLVRACVYMAAAIVCRELDPMSSSHGHSPDELESLAIGWLGPYSRS